MALRSYRELRVWEAAMQLAELAYDLTRGFPRDEMFGLSAQIRRAAASVPANIAEGYGRASRREYVRFLFIAQGSLKELETHALLATRVRCCDGTQSRATLDQLDVVGRMLGALIRKLRS